MQYFSSNDSKKISDEEVNLSKYHVLALIRTDPKFAQTCSTLTLRETDKKMCYLAWIPFWRYQSEKSIFE